MTDLPVVTVTLNPAIDQTVSIPSFAAGRVNRVTESRSFPGGKGVNVACVLADLGVEVIVTGFLGSLNAEIFEKTFQSKGIEDLFVRVPGMTRTGLKILDPSTERTTELNFPGLAPGREEVRELFERLTDLAVEDRWFVLSGSLPPGMPEDLYAPVVSTLRRRGCHVLLDTSGPPLRAALETERRPVVMKPNVDELAELTGETLETPAAVRAAAVSLLERGVGKVVVSMRGEGALFVEPGRALLAKPPRVTVLSTVGAGDAMVAGIVAALLRGGSLEDVARQGTACGAYAVTRLGAGIDNPAELRRLAGKVRIESLD
jgi:1-phosphofructokinase